MPVRVFLATLALAAALTGQSAPVREIRDSESYRVYEAAIRLDLPPKERSSVYFRETTVTMEDCMTNGTALPDGWRDVLADYKAQNAQPSRLVRGMDFDPPYELLSFELIEGLRQAWGDWAERRNQARMEPPEPQPSPEEFFDLSAVGFDHAKHRALVYVRRVCGFNCAEGQHWLLELRDGAWVKVRTETECRGIAD